MPNDPTRVEIITGHERRRRCTANGKTRLGRRHDAAWDDGGVSPSLLFKWRQLRSRGRQVAVKADEDVVAASRARDLEQRVRELERLLGRKAMEVELLKEALAVAREKKPVWQLPSPPRDASR
jgi:transposase